MIQILIAALLVLATQAQTDDEGEWLLGNRGAACAHGIQNGDSCCAKACGSCDAGDGCTSRGGGSNSCCPSHFTNFCKGSDDVGCRIKNANAFVPDAFTKSEASVEVDTEEATARWHRRRRRRRKKPKDSKSSSDAASDSKEEAEQPDEGKPAAKPKAAAENTAAKESAKPAAKPSREAKSRS